ncbi:50S ribosomal protein L18e [Candidatus Pacearchaeota archaeon]|nr:50S ribosomal protein L18e [Candidatus Pacearchaeota archaeon]
MKTKTVIEKQLQKKNNQELVKTIIAAKKNENWLEVASMLAGPRRNRININLEEIDKESKEGETIVIPGKVLSQGEVSKKIKIVSLNFSEKAKEKLLNAGVELLNILEEIKKNPQAKNIKVLKK